MARRDFRRGAAAVRSSRLTTWFQFQPVSTTIATNNGTNLVFSLNATALALRPFTIVRSHFELALQSDQAAAIEEQSIGFGIAVVSDQAVAAGIGSIPTPVTEAGSNLWFMHHFLFADESNLTDRTRNGQFRAYDSKAMRKVEVGQDLVVVLEGGGIGGGTITRIAGRLLIKNN